MAMGMSLAPLPALRTLSFHWVSLSSLAVSMCLILVYSLLCGTWLMSLKGLFFSEGGKVGVDLVKEEVGAWVLGREKEATKGQGLKV